jgi:hypothetical protein
MLFFRTEVLATKFAYERVDVLRHGGFGVVPD